MNQYAINNPMKMLEFFKRCKEDLQHNGQDDAAFYFEQVEDWLREGNDLFNEKPSKILGL